VKYDGCTVKAIGRYRRREKGGEAEEAREEKRKRVRRGRRDFFGDEIAAGRD
jgi:hypothetical protein